MAKIDAPKPIETQKSVFDDKIQFCANFLKEHYEISISVHDPSKKYISCKDSDRKNIEPNTDRISNHLAANNIIIGDAQLRKILSDPYYIPHVDPIKVYFDRIRGTWAGKSQIDLLCSHIKPRIFEDNTDEFYTQRAYKLIKKWLVACVAMWQHNIPNDVTLGLIQAEGGAGKSFLFKFLLPKELQDYYIESSNKEKNFDIEDVYTRFMLCNFEELEGLTKSTINTYKKVQSDDMITTKQRHETFASRKMRICCSVLNTNFNSENGGFIQPYFGSDTRRFGLIEIVDIDQKYSDLIEIDQLWAEALTLFESSSYEYHFDKPDYLDFNTYNARYRKETTAMKLLQKYVRQPEADETGEKMNSTQIHTKLMELRRIKSDDDITPQKIGHALNALGYEQISYRSKTDNNDSRKGYHLIFM